MPNYSIGISGLNAAQKAIDVIGNNIANAATPGYHRQRIIFSPSFSSMSDGILLGGGVDLSDVSRLRDKLLEQEILRQQTSLKQTSQEYNSLRTIETAFGELVSETGGLNTAIDEFFETLNMLSGDPGGDVTQNAVISAASSLATKFRTMGSFLTEIETQISFEVTNSVVTVNALITQIAELNGTIESLEIGGAIANNLRDQRDQYITELSELISVKTMDREYGVVDLSVGGMHMITGESYSLLEAGTLEGGDVGISIAGASNYDTKIAGGRIGGLLSLKNDIIDGIHNKLDNLASAIITQINQTHVQAVGSDGSFSTLSGWPMTSEVLSEFSPAITSGKIYIRVTNTSTGAITREEIDLFADITPASSAIGLTLSDIATYISTNVTGLSATYDSSGCNITADSNYKFDFLPGVLPDIADTTGLTGATPPTIAVSGLYTGTATDTFTFTVINNSGTVGNGTLQVEVKNSVNTVVATLDVGDGYDGSPIDITSEGNGIKVSFTSNGDLTVGDSFQIEALASSDTAGLFSSIGLNTFFSGSTASDIRVDVTAGKIATSQSSDMTDSANVSKMFALKDQAVSSLDSLTPGEFYRQLVTDIGQQLFVKKMNHENTEIIIQNLQNQQGDISGVDINEEAAEMLIFEQMFAAMAKYMNTLQSTVESIMALL